MNKIYSLLAILATITIGLHAEAKYTYTVKTDTVTVWGNCEMCKARIEKAAKAAGAKTAEWNEESHVLTVSYPDNKSSLKAIEEKVSAAGHDTQNFTAPDDVYKALPGCCRYQRKAASASALNTCCDRQKVAA